MTANNSKLFGAGNGLPRICVLYESLELYPFRRDEPQDANSELLETLYLDEIVRATQDLGYPCFALHADKFLADCYSLRAKADFVFNMSKGLRGPFKKSIVPAILESLELPYLGSDPYVLSFVRNKAHLKAFAAKLGIPTPEWAYLRSSADLAWAQIPVFPVIVKPCYESSSIGVDDTSVVHDDKSLRTEVDRVNKRYRQPAIAEQFIEGTECSVPILGNPPSRPWGTVGTTLGGSSNLGKRILTSEIVSRYKYGFEFPSQISRASEIEGYATRLFDAIGFRDYGRVDFRIDRRGNPFLLEASTHPHIEKHSDFFEVAKVKGISHTQLVGRLLEVSLGRNGLPYAVTLHESAREGTR